MTDVKTSIYLWTKDVTNIRCHVWCYWEQEFGEPMGTYLAHHWLVSETVVVDKKNTNEGWVFDFFCNTHMLWLFGRKKSEWKNHWFWVFENFQNQKNHWVRVFHKKKQNHRIIKESEWEMQRNGRGGIDGLKNRSGKFEGLAGGDWWVKEPEWEMWRIGWGGLTG
jgi:hypothetical protein